MKLKCFKRSPNTGFKHLSLLHDNAPAHQSAVKNLGPNIGVFTVLKMGKNSQKSEENSQFNLIIDVYE